MSNRLEMLKIMQNYRLNTSNFFLDSAFFFKCDENYKKALKKHRNENWHNKILSINKKYVTLKIIECPLRRFSENQEKHVGFSKMVRNISANGRWPVKKNNKTYDVQMDCKSLANEIGECIKNGNIFGKFICRKGKLHRSKV